MGISEITSNRCDFENIAQISVLDQLMSFPEHAEYAANIELDEVKKTSKVCIFAVGESVVAGEIMAAYADECSGTQVHMICDGRVPGWVDSDTSAILVSYSGGNEVISMVYDEVMSRGCKIYCLVSGGYLAYVCKRDGNNFIQLPTGMSARTATGYEVGVLSALLQEMGICNAKDALLDSIEILKDYRDRIVSLPFKWDISDKISGSIIAVYATSQLRAAFKRWRMAFDEDMGCPSFCGDLPEFDHNELVGWANHNQPDTDLKMVVLKCENESIVLDKIISTMIEVLKESNREVIVAKIKGNNPFERNIDAIMLGDYLAQIFSEESKDAKTADRWSA